MIGTEDDRAALKGRLTNTYHLLDPSLPTTGRYASKWKLRLNIEQDEIEAVRSA
jgi:predicted transcriptional regulator of viral defense system